MSLKIKAVYFLGMLAALLMAPLHAKAAPELLPMPDLGEDGMHIQPWFYESFLDLREDQAEAEAQGKRLMIVWEQRGCPYCKRMHEVNLRLPRIVEKLENNFLVIRLNLWGDREVTDFDGEVLKEKELANKWRVLFTPTLQFFPESAEKIGGAPGIEAEVVRIPGYFKPFHFFFLLHYAQTGGYESEPNFQRWLGGIGDRLEEAGVHYDLYADTLPDMLPDEF